MKTMTKEQMKKQAICPVCYNEPEHVVFKAIDQDRYARLLRYYAGHCCCGDFEVVQFARGDKWFIHEFKLFDRDWTKVNELPQPPLAMIGPGGDYDKRISAKTTNLLRQIETTMTSVLETVRALIGVAEAEDDNESEY